MQKFVSPAQAAVAQRDVATLQGAWRQLRHEAHGIESPPDEFDADATTIFCGNAFTVYNVDGTLVLSGTFSIDASCDPKAIDWIDAIGPDAGKVLPASYMLDGDTFVFIAGEEGAPRPTHFVTKNGETMRAFVRALRPPGQSFNV